MTSTQSLVHAPLARILLPQQTLLRQILLVVGGSLLVATMAQISIPLPFTPVPITGQTLGVLLVGASLGSRLGFLSLLTYVMEGTAGLPFFAGGAAGLAKLIGPTGGYLIAFPLAAALIGYLVERFGSDRHFLKMMGSLALCSLLIFGLGTTWLGVWLAMAGKFTGVWDLLMMGMIPFIPGDIVKSITAASLLPLSWKLIGRSQNPQ